MAYIDPVAQSFTVDAVKFPNGFFADSIDLCFKKTDQFTWQPIQLELRPTNGGYPYASLSYPFSGVVLLPTQINTSTGVGTDVPSFTDATKYTRFSFPAPVYLPPGEHCFVISTNSDQYQLYISEIGQVRLDGSDRLISKQPSAGALFKSQNGSVYTPDQNADFMFRINRCNFTTGTTSVVLNNVTPSINLVGDLIVVSTQHLTFKNAGIDYYYKSTDNATSTLSSYNSIKLDQNNILDDRIKIPTTTANSFVIKADLTTSDSLISPVIDTQRVRVVTVENIINNAGLSANNFTITNGGSAYTSNASITITGSNGSSANAIGVFANGNVSSIIVDAAGSGYTGSITATISGGGGSGATVSVASELNSSGGNCLARYITRRVVLNDGFDASTFRVYLDAYKPSVTNVLVYYKVLAGEDMDNFDSRPYVLMSNVQPGNETLLNTTSSQYYDEFKEYLFKPTTTDCSYVGTTSSVTYTKFKTFAIKIVMISSDVNIVPKIRGLRILAVAP